VRREPDPADGRYTPAVLTGDGWAEVVEVFDPLTRAQTRHRTVFRDALGVDGATWAPGRGWALTTGLNAHRAYAVVDARVAAETTRQITAAVAG
jgi:hypothetical protein